MCVKGILQKQKTKVARRNQDLCHKKENKGSSGDIMFPHHFTITCSSLKGDPFLPDAIFIKSKNSKNISQYIKWKRCQKNKLLVNIFVLIDVCE